MTSEDWGGAISLLVSNLHRSDKDLLQLLQRCVAGQQIASMEEAQALLLKNFRVGKEQPSECAQWLTKMARDLLAPIPFREVFVILALFLPQLSFVDDASARQDLWSSPTVRKHGLVVDITPTAAGLLVCKACMSIALLFQRGHTRRPSALHTFRAKTSNSLQLILPMQYIWAVR